MLRRILVPIDGTDHSWRALEYACALVSLSGGSLVIMTVTSGGQAQPVIAADGDCLYAQIGDEVLDAAHAMMLAKNIACSYLLATGCDIAENILHTALEEKCDGIVLGNRGMGISEGLFRSSVSRVVLEGAEVPVTIVK